MNQNSSIMFDQASPEVEIYNRFLRFLKDWKNYKTELLELDFQVQKQLFLSSTKLLNQEQQKILKQLASNDEEISKLKLAWNNVTKKVDLTHQELEEYRISLTDLDSNSSPFESQILVIQKKELDSQNRRYNKMIEKLTADLKNRNELKLNLQENFNTNNSEIKKIEESLEDLNIRKNQLNLKLSQLLTEKTWLLNHGIIDLPSFAPTHKIFKSKDSCPWKEYETKNYQENRREFMNLFLLVGDRINYWSQSPTNFLDTNHEAGDFWMKFEKLNYILKKVMIVHQKVSKNENKQFKTFHKIFESKLRCIERRVKSRNFLRSPWRSIKALDDFKAAFKLLTKLVNLIWEKSKNDL